MFERLTQTSTSKGTFNVHSLSQNSHGNLQVTCTIMHLTMFQWYPAFANVSPIEILLSQTWKRCKVISLGPWAPGPSFSHPICNKLQLCLLARTHLSQVLPICCPIPVIHRCFMKIVWLLSKPKNCCPLNQVQSVCFRVSLTYLLARSPSKYGDIRMPPRALENLSSWQTIDFDCIQSPSFVEIPIFICEIPIISCFDTHSFFLKSSSFAAEFHICREKKPAFLEVLPWSGDAFPFFSPWNPHSLWVNLMDIFKLGASCAERAMPPAAAVSVANLRMAPNGRPKSWRDSVLNQFKGGIQYQGDEIAMCVCVPFFPFVLDRLLHFYPFLVSSGSLTCQIDYVMMIFSQKRLGTSVASLNCMQKVEKYTLNKRAKQSFTRKCWANCVDFTMFHLWGTSIIFTSKMIAQGYIKVSRKQEHVGVMFGIKHGFCGQF